MNNHEDRVEHPDVHLDFQAGQGIKDPVPDPVRGIAHEHVVSGLVVAVLRWHAPPAVSVLQNMNYAVKRFLQVGTRHPALWEEGAQSVRCARRSVLGCSPWRFLLRLCGVAFFAGDALAAAAQRHVPLRNRSAASGPHV